MQTGQIEDVSDTAFMVAAYRAIESKRTDSSAIRWRPSLRVLTAKKLFGIGRVGRFLASGWWPYGPASLTSSHILAVPLGNGKSVAVEVFTLDRQRFELRENVPAGKGGMVFAVRLDTFPKEKRIGDFYIGTNDSGELTAIRNTQPCARVQARRQSNTPAASGRAGADRPRRQT